jgi:predicted ATPase
LRISSVEIINYRGVALATATGLADQAVLMISGKNGTGKTMVLEAIASAWQGRVRSVDVVGPWGDHASISVTVELEGAETAAVMAWNPQIDYLASVRSASYSLKIHKTEDRWTETSSDPIAKVLRSTSFQREYPFAEIDFLSAHRQSSASGSPSVDLGMFNRRQMQDQRQAHLQQHVEFGQDMYLPDVGSYLLTLDYHRYLAERQDLEPLDDFDLIAGAFERATGKVIQKPFFDTERGESGISVRLPSGPQHGLDVLSSGEREMLALMYFVRRLSATGGILMLDEPEKHLHPSLQGAVLEIARGMADRAQLVVVTHSVNMINAASPPQMLQMDPPIDAATNQLTRLADDAQRVDLLAALGIVPADLAQSDCLIVVEGARDAQWLTALFPVEMARAHLLIAGSGKQVEATCATLNAIAPPLPWMAVRDRDLMTAREVTELESRISDIFVWQLREFENVLLDAGLISRVLAHLGLTKSIPEVELLMREVASALAEDVVENMTTTRLAQEHPVARSNGQISRMDRRRENLRATAAAFVSRADAFDETVEEVRRNVNETWDDEWLSLVDGKAMLAAIRSKLEVFGSYDEFVGALLAEAKTGDGNRPDELRRIEMRIRLLLGREA